MARDSARRFQFLKEIASGGFGSVFVAKVMEQDGFARLMAVKLLHQRWSDNLEVSRRMKDEARLLGALRHRNIVNVFGFTTIGGRVAVMMEYLEAVDLKVVISHLAEQRTRMPTRAALEVIAAVAGALDAAWNQSPFPGERPLRVIHRDIKPSNIMVDDSGTVKVLDFGVARAEFDHRESHTQELQFGSVDYMPPERLFFEPETDRADVYSLGATLFELLAGKPLGKAKGREEKHVELLEERLATLAHNEDMVAVAHLLRAMCAYQAEARPSAQEVVQRTRAIARASMSESLGEWAERHIPELVNLTRAQMRDPNPLTESILAEDASALAADDTRLREGLAPDDETEIDGAPPRPPPSASVTAAAQEPPLEPVLPTLVFTPPADLAEDNLTSLAPRLAPPEPEPPPLGEFDDDAPTRVDAPAPPEPTNVAAAPHAGLPIRIGAPEPEPPSDDIVVIDDLVDDVTRAVGTPPPNVQRRDHEETLPSTGTPVVRGPSPQTGLAPRTPDAPSVTSRSPKTTPPVVATPDPDIVPARKPVALWAAAALLLVGVVAAGARLMTTKDAPHTDPPVPAATTRTAAAPAPASVPADAIVFRVPGDARKVRVSCAGASAEGAVEAFVAGPGPVDCTVAVVLADRSRRTAKVEGATTGAYSCFGGATDACTR